MLLVWVFCELLALSECFVIRQPSSGRRAWRDLSADPPTRRRKIFASVKAVDGPRRRVNANNVPVIDQENVMIAGRLSYFGASEVGAGDTLVVSYRPPPEAFPPQQQGQLYYMGGWNGWDGTQMHAPFMTPMLREGDGTLRCTVGVPNDALSVDFCITDGIRFDTNDDGQYYHIHVTHIQREADNGNIICLRQDVGGDGQITEVQTGVIEKKSGEEFEQELNTAYEQYMKQKELGGSSSSSEAGPTITLVLEQDEEGQEHDTPAVEGENAGDGKLRLSMYSSGGDVGGIGGFEREEQLDEDRRKQLVKAELQRTQQSFKMDTKLTQGREHKSSKLFAEGSLVGEALGIPRLVVTQPPPHTHTHKHA